MQFLRIQLLMAKAMKFAGLEAAGNDSSVFGPGIDASGDVEQSLAGLSLNLAPQSVGPFQHRDVSASFCVSEPDDAIHSVRRS